VGVNTDSVYSHIAFQKSLGGLSYPLASDRWPYAKAAATYEVFPAFRHPLAYVNDRAVFIVNMNGELAWSKVYDLKQKPDNAEILGALKTLPP